MESNDPADIDNYQKKKDNWDSTGVEQRKAKHLEICLDPEKYKVEDTVSSGYNSVKFIYTALPELSYDTIDTNLTFLDHTVKLPFFISCMTGGSESGFRVNKELAKAAQHAGIPVGMGSIRILFENEDVFPHFHLKPFAPDVPVLANLGSVQLRTINHKTILEMLKKLEVQAIVIHCNPGQELIQPEGDHDFTDLITSISRFCNTSSLPVIVKDTGCGIRPALVRTLLGMGVRYVNIAGSGGTNWLLVESYRVAGDSVAREFDSWGLPTALVQAVVGRQKGRILASGGIRCGTDIAKAIALGAIMAGLALPFVRELNKNGFDGVLKFIKQLEKGLKISMAMAGAENLEKLAGIPLLFDHSFQAAVDQLRKIEGF